MPLVVATVTAVGGIAGLSLVERDTSAHAVDETDVTVVAIRLPARRPATPAPALAPAPTATTGKQSEVGGAPAAPHRPDVPAAKALAAAGIAARGAGVIMTADAHGPTLQQPAAFVKISTAALAPPAIDVARAREASTIELDAGEEPASTPTSAPVESTAAHVIEGTWHEVEVAPGDSLYSIFNQLGLSQAEMLEVVRTDKRSRSLSNLHPGQRVVVAVGADGRIKEVAKRRNDGRALRVARNADGFASAVVPWEDIAGRGGAEDTRAPTEQSVEVVAPSDAAAELQPALARRDVTVGRGDSLYAIFNRHGYRVADLTALLAAGEESKRLTRIRPGQTIELHANGAGAIGRLVFPLDELRVLHVEREADGFRERVVETPVERRSAVASGSIEHSLFLAGQRSGLSDRTIMALIEIFGWDVDFALDIRRGDSFTVIHEELYKDGEKLRDGAILAAEFVNQGRVIRAVRYVDPDGRAEYFSPDGKSMRKAFLRSPVNFTRISSRFSIGRKHPILHRLRAHRGVDYAASRGTPVRAAGDGKIEHAGRKGGFGKTVVLRHGSERTTLYAHLSRYGRKVKRGRSVRQGQIIGYVGSTGLATGPHLHYEFRVRGVHKDPLKVKLGDAKPIDKAYEKEFTKVSAPLLARLEAASNTVLASRE